MKSLENKVALITGAGSGIGKAIARLFAHHGAKVLLVDAKYENIEMVATQISREKGSVKCFAANISNEMAVKALFKFVHQTYGTLDILVNNAGIMDDFVPAAELENRKWKSVIGTNLTGPFYCCRHAIRLFLKKGGGNIINISSVAGLCGGRAGLAYTVSKHGLIGLTKNIGYQYALKGIRCNAIAPGSIETNILYQSHPNPFGLDRMEAGSANMPPAGSPEQIARISLFLAIDESSYINGSVVVADGGWTAY